MSPSALSLSRLAVAIAVLGVAGRASAQLASKSPFMAPQAAATNAPTAGAPLQYIGYMDTHEGRQFREFDPAKKTGAWVRLNEKNSELDVLAKQHDESQKPSTLVIEYQGKTITLAEREAKIVSSGSAGQVMPPPQAMPVANVPPAVTQAVVLNPTPADEQRRLEAVAAEVARRRALREQATQQINQGANPQVGVPQPAMQPQVQPPQNYQTGQRSTSPTQNPRQR